MKAGLVRKIGLAPLMPCTIGVALDCRLWLGNAIEKFGEKGRLSSRNPFGLMTDIQLEKGEFSIYIAEMSNHDAPAETI
jgi:hypothetical protein